MVIRIITNELNNNPTKENKIKGMKKLKEQKANSMKKIIVIVTILWNNVNAQTNKSLDYYNEGSKAATNKQYQLADSLYTLSLNLKPNADTYYNRAVVRKNLNRMSDYCSDIGSASALEDKESTDLFWKDCCSKDTIYYNKGGSVTNKGDHDYFVVLCKMKYSPDNSYRKYSRTNKKLVSYEVKNSDTVFSLTPVPPVYPENEDNIKMILMNNTVLKEDDVKNMKVWWAVVTYTVLKNGENADIKCKSNIGKSYDDKVEAIFKKYIKKWQPAEYNGKKVKYSMSVAFRPIVKKN